MSLASILSNDQHSAPSSYGSVWLALTLAICLCSVSVLNAQTQASQLSLQSKPVLGTTSAVVLGAPSWVQLSLIQQKSLAPLFSTWDTLTDGHKRKWLALAQGYPTLAPQEQTKLHSRMAEWAALKPKDREQARLNFAETKKIAPQDRNVNWEAYQALTPEERKKLADSAQVKSIGASFTVKPVAPQKLADIRVTQKTPETKRTLVENPAAINQNTLLPIPPDSTPRLAPSD